MVFCRDNSKKPTEIFQNFYFGKHCNCFSVVKEKSNTVYWILSSPAGGEQLLEGRVGFHIAQDESLMGNTRMEQGKGGPKVLEIS